MAFPFRDQHSYYGSSLDFEDKVEGNRASSFSIQLNRGLDLSELDQGGLALLGVSIPKEVLWLGEESKPRVKIRIAYDCYFTPQELKHVKKIFIRKRPNAFRYKYEGPEEEEEEEEDVVERGEDDGGGDEGAISSSFSPSSASSSSSSSSASSSASLPPLAPAVVQGEENEEGGEKPELNVNALGAPAVEKPPPPPITLSPDSLLLLPETSSSSSSSSNQERKERDVVVVGKDPAGKGGESAGELGQGKGAGAVAAAAAAAADLPLTPSPPPPSLPPPPPSDAGASSPAAAAADSSKEDKAVENDDAPVESDSTRRKYFCRIQAAFHLILPRVTQTERQSLTELELAQLKCLKTKKFYEMLRDYSFLDSFAGFRFRLLEKEKERGRGKKRRRKAASPSPAGGKIRRKRRTQQQQQMQEEGQGESSSDQGTGDEQQEDEEEEEEELKEEEEESCSDGGNKEEEEREQDGGVDVASSGGRDNKAAVVDNEFEPKIMARLRLQKGKALAHKVVIAGPHSFFEALNVDTNQRFEHGPALILSKGQKESVEFSWRFDSPSSLYSLNARKKFHTFVALECEQVKTNSLRNRSRHLLKGIPIVFKENESEEGYYHYESPKLDIIPLNSENVQLLHFSLRDFAGNIIRGRSVPHSHFEDNEEDRRLGLAARGDGGELGMKNPHPPATIIHFRLYDKI